MAISPIPFHFTSTNSPSKSVYFKFQSQSHSLSRFRAQKFKISCCQQTVQFDNETQQRANPIKKKRKPRPSFVQQIQEKWSVKNPSLRENFPWQEEGSFDTNQEFQPQRLQQSEDILSRTEIEKNDSVSDAVCSDFKVKSILAPWAHGNEPRKKHFTSDRINENVVKEDQCENVVEESKDSANGVMLDGMSKDNGVPIGFSDEKEISSDEGSKKFTFLEDSLSASREISTVNRPAGVSSVKRLPWESVTDEGFGEGEKRKGNTDLAERLLPESEFKRLRNLSLNMVERTKVGSAGVTQAIVDAIHEKWKNEEVVRLKFEGPPTLNMKRAHQVLESRTGGLVIWRSGSSVVLYRGMTYKLDCVKSYRKSIQADTGASGPSGNLIINTKHVNHAGESSKSDTSNYLNNLSEEEEVDLTELNLLLDELGPRFIDWSGRAPLPVDADLLPAVVPDYKTPFRLQPYGTRRTLRNQEMTYLRRTARTLPPHFALGRNRELQGLATAIVKLWEKSAIAKIAIKRGVLNTSNERMAEELKILTGGTLISRNKEYIVLYRGNDFLPPSLSNALKEAENSIAFQQDEEEQARNRAAAIIDPNTKGHKQPLVAGTLSETVAATSRWGNQPDSAEMEKMMRDAAIARQAFVINSLQQKLALAKAKIGQAEKALQKLHEDREPADLPTDLETLSDEERFLFRKIGLRMKPYLLLGRREVFDGVIENMHLHWKHRELVKLLVERRTFSQVKHIAVSLEAESGGVLISIEKSIKGYVIILYRGKNYQRPTAFRPKNLLTKREALARSIELQRREALKHHVLELEEKIEKLKNELEDMETANLNEQIL